MRFSRILILGLAALGGTWVYKTQNGDFKDPENLGAADRSAYSTLSGHGSIMETFKAARSNSTAGGPQGLLSVAPPMNAGGIGKVGSLNGGGTGNIGGGAGTGTRGQTLGGSSAPGLPGAPADKGPSDDQQLINAAAKGDKEGVSRRIQEHMRIDSRDGLRRTALMYAAANGFTDIIERLLAAGATPTLEDRSGNNAFDFAAGRGLTDVVQFMLRHSHESDDHHYMEYAALMQAVLAGDASRLPEGRLSTVNRLNTEGQSALHIASGNGSLDLATELVKRGADVNLRGSAHQTPLHWAAWNNQAAVIELLLGKGADISQKDTGGNTALILAARNNGSEAVKLLLAKGARRDVANKEGKTAAIIADDMGFASLVPLLH